MYFKVLRKYDEQGNLLLKQDWDELARKVDEQKNLEYPFYYYNKSGNGILLTDADNILTTLYFGDQIAIITIPENSAFISVDIEESKDVLFDKPIKMSLDCTFNKYTGFFRSHKVKVVKVLDIWKVETFELLKRLGVNLAGYGGSALDAAAEKGHLDIVKYLLKEGFENESFGINMALKTAKEKGYEDIVECLLEFKSKNS